MPRMSAPQPSTCSEQEPGTSPARRCTSTAAITQWACSTGRYDRALPGRRSLLTGFVVVAVAVAFADSSIVVLALPELYLRFDTTIEGVSWVVTAYNASVALVALLLVLVVHRWRAAY